MASTLDYIGNLGLVRTGRRGGYGPASRYEDIDPPQDMMRPQGAIQGGSGCSSGLNGRGFPLSRQQFSSLTRLRS
eukprot:3493879-Rhodomonas_salina.1